VTNRGTQPLIPEGPARTILCGRIESSHENAAVQSTPLPGLLPPGRTVAAAIPVSVPELPGTYRVSLWAQRAEEPIATTATIGTMQLVVEPSSAGMPDPCCAPLLDLAEAALAEAQRLQRLPDNYTDVTEGRFARWKRWIKRKLLGNFQHAYVDVLSRQQSAVNAQLVTALRELTECCATLDHAVRQMQEAMAKRNGEDRGLLHKPEAQAKDAFPFACASGLRSALPDKSAEPSGSPRPGV